jgi:flagellar motility protein MotE (MotC chaperone)
VDDFMTKLDETRHIDMAMTYLRKLWIPQAGQGSQSEELSFNKALVDAMNEHFDTRAAEDEESDREDAELEEKYKAAEVKKKRIATKKKKTKKKK